MKADLAIYISMPGQYKSVAIMLSYKLDFSCCANKDGFRGGSHIFEIVYFFYASSLHSMDSTEMLLSIFSLEFTKTSINSSTLFVLPAAQVLA